MEKKTNKAKLEILNFWQNRLNRKAIAFDKISRNWALYGNSINHTLTRVFLHAESISAMKTMQNPTVFMKTQKIIANHWFLLIVWDFHWNSWAEDCHKKP